jgi:hypothetical protein
MLQKSVYLPTAMKSGEGVTVADTDPTSFGFFQIGCILS